MVVVMAEEEIALLLAPEAVEEAQADIRVLVAMEQLVPQIQHLLQPVAVLEEHKAQGQVEEQAFTVKVLHHLKTDKWGQVVTFQILMVLIGSPLTTNGVAAVVVVLKAAAVLAAD
jgi:hypothetical protein